MLKETKDVTLIKYTYDDNEYDTLCYRDNVGSYLYYVENGYIRYKLIKLTNTIIQNIPHIDTLNAKYTILCDDRYFDILYVSEYDVLYTNIDNLSNQYDKKSFYINSLDGIYGNYDIVHTRTNLDFIDSL